MSAETFPDELGERVQIGNRWRVSVDPGERHVVVPLQATVRRGPHQGSARVEPRDLRAGRVIGADRNDYGRAPPAVSEREAERDRQVLEAHPAFQSQPLCQPGTAGQEQLGFLRADRHGGHDRHAGLDRRRDVAGPAIELDGGLLPGRPPCVVVSAGKSDGQCTRVQRLHGVVAVGTNHAQSHHEFSESSLERQVVGEGVQRAVIAELLEEVDPKDRGVHRQCAAGMVHTISAPPDGSLSRPRTSERNQSLHTGRATVSNRRSMTGSHSPVKSPGLGAVWSPSVNADLLGYLHIPCLS
jgi:hypothetical protein